MIHHEGLDLTALRQFLVQSEVVVDGELRAALITGGKSNLTYAISDGASKWVLRRPPTSGLTPTAHDVAREFRITAGLQGTGVPVAKTVALCEDNEVIGAPFTVVEHVKGQVIRTKIELDALSDTRSRLAPLSWFECWQLCMRSITGPSGSRVSVDPMATYYVRSRFGPSSGDALSQKISMT